MKQVLFLICYMTFAWSFAQEVDPDLMRVRSRLDSIMSFEADVIMDVDISFIHMPTKHATITYRRGKGSKIHSKDFVMLPKRGLDLTLEDVFKYPFITVQRGTEDMFGITTKVLNIIPTSEKAEFSIATISIHTATNRIMKLQISTKKEGVYTSLLRYEDANAVLPSMIEVLFEVNNIRIPLQFLGKETQVDKAAIKEDGVKSGKIILMLKNTTILN